MGDPECHGRGTWDGRGECACDRLYTHESRCEDSFKDATGAAWPVAQVVCGLAYLLLLRATVRQLLLLQLLEGRPQAPGPWALQGLRTAVLSSIALVCCCRLLWCVDPYGLDGRIDATFSVFVNHVGNLLLILTATLSMLYWRRALRASQTRALEGRVLKGVLALWLVLSGVFSALLVHREVEGGDWQIKAMNILAVGVVLSQTAVLLHAAGRLRGAVLQLDDSILVVRLLNLVNSWTLAAACGAVVAVMTAAFVALELDTQPWAFTIMIFVVLRACFLLSLVVFLSSTAVTPVPWARAVTKVVLVALCMWVWAPLPTRSTGSPTSAAAVLPMPAYARTHSTLPIVQPTTPPASSRTTRPG